MNVLFLSVGQLNNIEDRGIYTDLFRHFRDHGHNIYIVCPRERRLNMPTEFIEENGIQFLRVRIGNITKVNVIEKGISTLMIEYLFLKAIKIHLKNVKFDLVIYSTPPITFEKIVRYIKVRDKAKAYLLLKDIFPQNAVDLDMLTKWNPIYWYFRYKEKKLYRISDFIGCMSPANVKYVLKHNPEVSNNTIVEVCPNSIEPIKIEINRGILQAVRKRYNIPLDKTVFIYGGNLGKPQGVDFLIECLRTNISNQEIYFVIAGSGTEFKKLKTFFESEKPPNAQLFNYLPREEYEMLVSACDVGLIFLDKRFTIPNFPSRLLSYMQASLPVLAATDVNTDIGQIIEQGQFGFWCESGNVEKFNKHIQTLCDENLRRKMGANAREYLLENYTVKHSYEIIMKHFKS